MPFVLNPVTPIWYSIDYDHQYPAVLYRRLPSGILIPQPWAHPPHLYYVSTDNHAQAQTNVRLTLGSYSVIIT